MVASSAENLKVVDIELCVGKKPGQKSTIGGDRIPYQVVASRFH